MVGFVEVRVLVADASASSARQIARELDARGFHTVVTDSCSDACGHPGPFDYGIFSAELSDGSGISLAGWLLAEDRIYGVVFFDPTEDAEVLARMANLGTVVARNQGVDALCNALENRLKAVGERARAVGAADPSYSGRQEEKSGRRRKRFE